MCVLFFAFIESIIHTIVCVETFNYFFTFIESIACTFAVMNASVHLNIRIFAMLWRDGMGSRLFDHIRQIVNYMELGQIAFCIVR
jgi:hypothetical protein